MKSDSCFISWQLLPACCLMLNYKFILKIADIYSKFVKDTLNISFSYKIIEALQWSDVADGPHSIILNQVENGVAVRMAALYLLAQRQADYRCK